MVNPDLLGGRTGNRMFQLAYLYAQMRDGVIPDIYVQDPKYFDKYSDEIKVWFGDGIIQSDYVGIHVRRGDYCGNTFYTDLTETDYYQVAMDMFPNATFKVFSDDIEWCREQSIFKDCVFSSGENEIDDFNMLAGCKGLIIANSSYSHMCGIINPNKEKVIICPYEENYYKDGIVRTVFPKYFTRIKYESSKQ